MGPLGGRGCYLTHLQLSCQGFLLIRETISPSEMSSNSLTQCKLVCFVFALCPSRSLCLSATPKWHSSCPIRITLISFTHPFRIQGLPNFHTYISRIPRALDSETCSLFLFFKKIDTGVPYLSFNF